jgi:hypothetical protein
MQFLAIGRYVNDAETLQRAQAAQVEEVRYAWDAYIDQTLRQAWIRTDGQAPILLLEAATVDDARNLLDRSPYVRDRVIEWDLIELTAFHPYSALFDTVSELEGTNE